MPGFLSRYRDQWMLALILGLLVGFFHLASGNFITGATFASVTNRIPTLTLVATGMTLVLIIGGIDLSVGSVLALSGAVLSTLVIGMGWPLGLGMVASLLVGALAGGVNGWITEKLRVPSFIVTLGTLEIARGLAYKVMNSETKYLGGKVDWLVQTLGNTLITPVLILAVLVVVLAQWVLSRGVLGRKMIAIGTNEMATRLAGISTVPVKVLVFVVIRTQVRVWNYPP
jgi:ribose transport system permease protein